MSLTGTTLPFVKSWTCGYVFTFQLVCNFFQFFYLFDCFIYWYSLLVICDLVLYYKPTGLYIKFS